MTLAYVIDKETILCRQTLDGWLPSAVQLPAIIDDRQLYELGRVTLLASSENTQNQIEQRNDTSAIATISYHYALTNNIDLPIILAREERLNHSQVSASGADVFAFIAYRQLITLLPAIVINQLSQAIQLLRWQADTQFCSRCAAPVSLAEFGERAMVCSDCKLRQYPRVQPCVIVAITRSNPISGEMQILLAHHHRYGQTSPNLQYGLIAGFVEAGESLEHAVVREVFEEVGIHLADINYVSSQPWPFPSNLMIAFRATFISGEIVLQEDELSHADFFDISNLPKIPFKGSIAYDLIAQVAKENGITL